MTGSHQSLSTFAKTEITRFLRVLVGMVLLVGVIGLPATVVILGLLPEAIDYLVVAMASLVVLMTGTWDRHSSRGRRTGEDDSPTFETTNEAIFVTAVLYAFLAGAFSALLVTSVGLGYAIVQLGFPTVGLAAAVAFPYLDHWGSNLPVSISVVNLSWLVIARLLEVLSFLLNVPSSLTAEVNHHRRNLY